MYFSVSLVQTRYENIPSVLKYAVFGTGPLTVLGGVEVKAILFCKSVLGPNLGGWRRGTSCHLEPGGGVRGGFFFIRYA